MSKIKSFHDGEMTIVYVPSDQDQNISLSGMGPDGFIIQGNCITHYLFGLFDESGITTTKELRAKMRSEKLWDKKDIESSTLYMTQDGPMRAALLDARETVQDLIKNPDLGLAARMILQEYASASQAPIREIKPSSSPFRH